MKNIHILLMYMDFDYTFQNLLPITFQKLIKLTDYIFYNYYIFILLDIF